MGKKRMVSLEYIGSCDAEYWDEKGSHVATPGMELVKFTPAMAKIREREQVWQKPEKKATTKTKKKATARKKAAPSVAEKGGEE